MELQIINKETNTMCGLAGIILKQQTRKDSEIDRIKKSFEIILKQANTRGGHATGFALIDKNGDYVLCKRDKDAYKFFTDNEVIQSIDLTYDNITCLMGHTRYATLGSPSINSNNHPIRTGNTIGTHNGSIHNHKELFHKYNMTRFAQVDSEAIFRLYEESDNAKDFADNKLPKVRGRVAIVWADLEFPDYVYVVKANNPFEIGFVPSLNIYVYGSTREIIDSAFRGKYEPINIKPNTMIRINTKTLQIRSKNITITKPIETKNSFYNPKIGAYQKTSPRFVPRFSFSDQQKLFTKYKTQDGSIIRKIK